MGERGGVRVGEGSRGKRYERGRLMTQTCAFLLLMTVMEFSGVKGW